MNFQDDRNASNLNLNYQRQVITFQHRILGIEIRVFNQPALAQCREYSTPTCNGLPSRTDLAAPLSTNGTTSPDGSCLW
jgi:hypothetical protein